VTAGAWIIEATDLTKRFPGGVVALDRFSLAVRRGEVVVIIGPSGSGKSTFLRCLNGLEEIDGGAVVIDGIPLDQRKKNRLLIRQEVGMVFQSFNLFPHMTVRENIDLAQVLVRKKTRPEAARTTADLLR
jgi:polar amino acid transport system ATP-binding protein